MFGQLVIGLQSNRSADFDLLLLLGLVGGCARRLQRSGNLVGTADEDDSRYQKVQYWVRIQPERFQHSHLTEPLQDRSSEEGRDQEVEQLVLLVRLPRKRRKEGKRKQNRSDNAVNGE